MPIAAHAAEFDNCGFELTIDSPPERVITVKSTSTEMLLALGLGDRIIGHAFQDGPPAEDRAEAYAAIPVLADKLPSKEAALARNPDFIYAGWESNLSAKALGDRASLAALGIGSYVSPAACRTEGYRPGKLTFDDVFEQIGQIGEIFGVSDRAAELVADQKERLSAATPLGDGRTVVWYSSGTDTPYVGTGIGAPQMVMEAAGLTNIAADIESSWASLSWEAIADADPDFLILIDASWNKAENKIRRLEETPVLATMKAVRDKRYLIVPFPASEAGIRSVEAVEAINRQIAEIDARQAN